MSPQTGAIVGMRHDRKREVHRLLQQECQTMMQQGWEIMIAGDVNVARSRLDGCMARDEAILIIRGGGTGEVAAIESISSCYHRH